MNHRRSSLIVKLGILLFLVEKNHGKALNRDDDSVCTILINGGLPEPQPLLLSPKIGKHDFLYPDETGIGRLVTLAGDSIRLACPESKLNLSNSIGSYNDTIVTCLGGNNFYLENAGIKKSFDKLSCEKYPISVARRTGGKCDNGVTLEIGFPVETQTVGMQKRQEFRKMIDLCHDERLGHTIYAHAKIMAVIDAAQTSFRRIPFRKGNFFSGIPINQNYGRDAERETIGRILNSTTLAEYYIPEKGSNFLSRGHLIAKSDFVYGSQQRATFFYINAVPMWQNINAGNWGTMEANVRSLAIEKKIDLDVWAGSIGILTLKDNKGRQREIYLHVDKKKNAVPVPKILFKVVYHKHSRSGIVFLTANNPYLEKLTNDYKICKDVCHRINYMTWNVSKGDRGFSYCCEVDDFRKAFPSIPSFSTESLLL